MAEAHVGLNGRVHVYGVRIAIGDVDRLKRGWLARVYGQPARSSFFKLRRDAVAWIVSNSSLVGNCDTVAETPDKDHQKPANPP